MYILLHKKHALMYHKNLTTKYGWTVGPISGRNTDVLKWVGNENAGPTLRAYEQRPSVILKNREKMQQVKTTANAGVPFV